MADEAEVTTEDVASADAGANSAEAASKDAGTPKTAAEIAAGKEPPEKVTGADTVEGGDVDEAAEPDWREKWANGDKDLLKLAKRYGSEAGVLRALNETKKQLSKGAGAFVDQLPEDATDEQKAEWRKARGVPESPDKYDIAVEGAEWDDDAKKDLGIFTEEAHAAGVPQKFVSLALQHFTRVAAAKEQQLLEDGAKFATESEKILKQEYGRDYVRNTKIMEEFGHSKLGEEAYHNLMTKRFADGTVLGDDPRMARLMIDTALENSDGLPFESGGATGGASDKDILDSHADLTRKAMGDGADAKDAQRKMRDPEYEKKIAAVYERQERRAGKKAA